MDFTNKCGPRRENIPVRLASDWSVVRKDPRVLRLVRLENRPVRLVSDWSVNIPAGERGAVFAPSEPPLLVHAALSAPRAGPRSLMAPSRARPPCDAMLAPPAV
eukprot:1826576-Pyramimonas_sp.AAC.1